MTTYERDDFPVEPPDIELTRADNGYRLQVGLLQTDLGSTRAANRELWRQLDDARAELERVRGERDEAQAEIEWLRKQMQAICNEATAGLGPYEALATNTLRPVITKAAQ